MNKFSKELTEYITKLFNICNLCEIDDVVIEKEMVRGQSSDAKRGIYIMEYDNIPSMDFSGLGIRDVKTLKSRMAILDDADVTISYETKEKDNGDFIVKKIIMSNKKTKVEFTCTDPIHIRSPKKLPDPDTYSFSLTEDTVKVMNKIRNAIAGVNNISFNSEKDGSIKFIVNADNGDLFDHTVSDKYEKLTDDAKNHFYHSYNIKYVSALFKAALDFEGEAQIILSSRGIIKMNVKGFTIRIVPEVD